MNDNKYYRHKRTVAHWILSQILSDSIKQYVESFIIDSQGRVIILKDGFTRGEFEYSQVRIIYLIEQKKYSRVDIHNAISLLFTNKHIEVDVNTEYGYEESLIKATHEGRKAYEDIYYINQREEHWNRQIVNTSNWLTPVMTLVVAIAALVVSIVQCNASNKPPNTEPTRTVIKKKN